MSEIIGPAAAKAALTKLVADIKDSLTAAGPAGSPAYAQAVDKAQRDFEAFFKSTRAADLADPVEVAAVRAIDEIAFDLLVTLSLDELEGNIRKLEEGAAKLAKLGGALGAQAEINVKAAASIGLEPVKEAIDSLTEVVETVKELKANLSAADPDEAKVAAEIDKLVAQFETLRSAARRIG
jgi:hypothetical protein